MYYGERIGSVMNQSAQSIIPEEYVASKIYFIRGQKVILDSDLADFYGIETGNLNKAVKRNIERFPEDFMFQLTKEELENWRSQIVTSNLNIIFTDRIYTTK